MLVVVVVVVLGGRGWGILRILGGFFAPEHRVREVLGVCGCVRVCESEGK